MRRQPKPKTLSSAEFLAGLPATADAIAARRVASTRRVVERLEAAAGPQQATRANWRALVARLLAADRHLWREIASKGLEALQARQEAPKPTHETPAGAPVDEER